MHKIMKKTSISKCPGFGCKAPKSLKGTKVSEERYWIMCLGFVQGFFLIVLVAIIQQMAHLLAYFVGHSCSFSETFFLAFPRSRGLWIDSYLDFIQWSLSDSTQQILQNNVREFRTQEYGLKPWFPGLITRAIITDLIDCLLLVLLRLWST